MAELADKIAALLSRTEAIPPQSWIAMVMDEDTHK